jgi:hypothetical protein
VVLFKKVKKISEFNEFNSLRLGILKHSLELKMKVIIFLATFSFYRYWDMKKFRAFIFNFIFNFIFISTCLQVNSLYGEISPKDLKGLDSVLQEEFKEQVSPLNGMTLLINGSLAQLRFLGNFGAKVNGINCLDEYSMGISFKKNNDCPQDFTMSLLQKFFPSPDGEILVANQIPSDPVSGLSAAIIGEVLSKITEFSDVDLHNDKLQNELALKLEVIFSQERSKFYKWAKEEIVQKTKDKKRIENGWTECEAELKEQKISQLSLEISDLGQKCLNQKNILESDLVKSLRDKSSKGRKFQQLSLTLIKALAENRKVDSLYPKFLPEKILGAFFLKKFHKKADFLDYFQTWSPRLIKNERLDSFIKSAPFEFEDLPVELGVEGTLKAKDLEKFKLKIQEDPAHLIYAASLDKMGTSGFPAHIEPSYAQHPSLKKSFVYFPNCGEESIRNVFNQFLYDSTTRKFNLERLKSLPQLKLDSKFLEYYELYPTLEEAKTKEAINFWGNEVISKRPKVFYLKPQSLNPQFGQVYDPKVESSPQCEMGAGLENSLNVINQLLFSMDEMEPLSQLKTKSEKLDVISGIFSHDNFVVTWQASGEIDLLNVNLKIHFEVNKIPIFTWQFDESHFFTTSLLKNNDNGWYSQLSTLVFPDLILGNSSLISLMPKFLLEKHMSSLREIEKIRPFFKEVFFSFPFKGEENLVTQVFRILFLGPSIIKTPLEKMLNRITDKLSKEFSEHALNWQERIIDELFYFDFPHEYIEQYALSSGTELRRFFVLKNYLEKGLIENFFKLVKKDVSLLFRNFKLGLEDTLINKIFHMEKNFEPSIQDEFLKLIHEFPQILNFKVEALNMGIFEFLLHIDQIDLFKKVVSQNEKFFLTHYKNHLDLFNKEFFKKGEFKLLDELRVSHNDLFIKNPELFQSLLSPQFLLENIKFVDLKNSQYNSNFSMFIENWVDSALKVNPKFLDEFFQFDYCAFNAPNWELFEEIIFPVIIKYQPSLLTKALKNNEFENCLTQLIDQKKVKLVEFIALKKPEFFFRNDIRGESLFFMIHQYSAFIPLIEKLKMNHNQFSHLTPNHFKSLPLHFVVENYDFKMLEYLVRFDREQFFFKNNDSENPINILLRASQDVGPYNEFLKKVIKFYPDIFLERDLMNNNSQAFVSFTRFSNKNQVPLEIYLNDHPQAQKMLLEIDEKGQNLLHYYLSNLTCQSKILMKIIELNPEILKQEDQEGRSPWNILEEKYQDPPDILEQSDCHQVYLLKKK